MIRAAVLGSPISHSLSPVLHQSVYDQLGIDGDYGRFEVGSGQLSKFIKGIDNGWAGFSLTMPLKEEVIAVADEVDELARRINSANTLIPSPTGWKAFTTDVHGFSEALRAHGFFEFQSILILGSGGTARAVAAACDGVGRKISVLHRNPAREEAMKRAAPLAQMDFRPWGDDLLPADLIVNTTPAQVADSYAERLRMPLNGVFFDALYYPWPTKLLHNWRALGGYGIDGLDLLIHQGLDQISLMTHERFDRDVLAPLLRVKLLEAITG